jgi:N-acetylmuramoyl-L-alanine amidase
MTNDQYPMSNSLSLVIGHWSLVSYIAAASQQGKESVVSRTFALGLTVLIALSSVIVPTQAASSKSRKKAKASVSVQRTAKASTRARVVGKARASKNKKLARAAKSKPKASQRTRAVAQAKPHKGKKVAQAAKKSTKAKPKPPSVAAKPKPSAASSKKVANATSAPLPTTPKVTAMPSLETTSIAPKTTFLEKVNEDNPAPKISNPPVNPAVEPPKVVLTAAPKKIFVAGDELTLPAPTQLVKDEVLAPLTEGLTQLGAKVELRSSDKSLHVESASGKRVSLYANNPNAIVNNKSELLPVAPTFDGAHFFVPLFATAKALDLAARADKSGNLHIHPTLTAVQVIPKEREMEVKMILSAPAPYKANQIQDTVSKVYVDLEQTVAALPVGEVWKGLGDVQRVRVGQFADEPPVTRVVVDMAYLLDYTVKKSEKPNEVVIGFALTTPTQQTSAMTLTGDELKDRLIVVDAGHGGKDPGTSGNNGSLEKNVTLDIALRLRECLMKRGATVLMTRMSDTYPTLAERASLANRSRAHLFVSVHVNAHSRPNTMSGTMVLYATPQSVPLARNILKCLLEELQRPDKGIRYRPGLYVLRHTAMPSVIAEVAYLDHDEEEALLNDPEFRQRAAAAMARGVVDYVQTYGK